MTVSDEAVEAAAREVYHTSGRYRVMPFGQAKSDCEHEARRILDAAAPFIAAQAWDEGWVSASMWDAYNMLGGDKPSTDNPHRSGT